MPGDTTQKPGPGAHSPERVSISCSIIIVSYNFNLLPDLTRVLLEYCNTQVVIVVLLT